MKSMTDRYLKILKVITLSVLFWLIFLGDTRVVLADGSGNIAVSAVHPEKGTALEGISYSLYQVSDYDSLNGSFLLTDSFADCKADLSSLRETENFASVCTALTTYVSLDEVAPIQTVLTDAEGKAEFQGLADGVYLICQTNTQSDFDKWGYTVFSEPMLLVLPYLNDNKEESRTIEAKPKLTVETPESDTIEVTVYKVWKDSSDIYKLRPASIEVGLYRGDTLQDKVKLDASCNWTYTWSSLDSSADWTVDEITELDDYEKTVTAQGTVFTITNTIDTPSTGSTVETEKSGSSGSGSGSSSSGGSSSGSSSSGSSGGSSSDSVKTGDATPIGMYLAMLVLAVLLAGSLISRMLIDRKKQG